MCLLSSYLQHEGQKSTEKSKYLLESVVLNYGLKKSLQRVLLQQFHRLVPGKKAKYESVHYPKPADTTCTYIHHQYGSYHERPRPSTHWQISRKARIPDYSLDVRMTRNFCKILPACACRHPGELAARLLIKLEEIKGKNNNKKYQKNSEQNKKERKNPWPYSEFFKQADLSYPTTIATSFSSSSGNRC